MDSTKQEIQEYFRGSRHHGGGGGHYSGHERRRGGFYGYGYPGYYPSYYPEYIVAEPQIITVTKEVPVEEKTVLTQHNLLLIIIAILVIYIFYKK
jgi:hypothetical protein